MHTPRDSAHSLQTCVIMKRTGLIILILLITSSIVFFLVILSALPGRIDRLLLLNNEFCCDESRDCVRLHKRGNSDMATNIVDFIIWKCIHYLWERQREERQLESDFEIAQEASLHPLCQSYREFRSTIEAQYICIPWNWYYSCRLHLRHVSIRSLTKEMHSCQREGLQLQWNSQIAYCIRLPSANHESALQLPPAIGVESVDIGFQSWTKPVVSMDLNGVELNFVLQKGKLAIPTPLLKPNIDKNNEADKDTSPKKEDNTGLSLLIGDMTIHTAISRLPKPPEEEGLYPMIGLINITNVKINVHERSIKKGQPRLHNMVTLNVSNDIFNPLLNLTSGELQ